jgi:YVTN family beta-propeller protein
MSFPLKRAVSLGLMLALAGCQSSLPRPSRFAVGATYPVEGPGGWDLLAVDAQRAHLFLSRGDRVQVLDTRDGHLAGTVAGTAGAHGVAVAEALHRGYITNGASNTVTEFDLDTLQRVRDLPVSGQSPDALLYDAFSGHLFVFNARSNNASVIDPASGREIATIAFEGNPELGATDGKGRVFVNIEDKGQVVEIDAGKLRIAHTWALADCEGPTGLALDVVHARLFSACDNQVLAVTDADSGRNVARVPIGEGPDGVAYDPALRMVFSPNGKSGTLTVVQQDDADHYRVLQTLPTQTSARTLALDPASHRLYLPAARFAGAPAPGQRRPPMVPGSFNVLMVEPTAPM